jgi:hypothetical protein
VLELGVGIGSGRVRNTVIMMMAVERWGLE